MPPLPASDDAEMARAFQELAKGEQTAAAMEQQLTALEHKLDDLLASVIATPEGADSSFVGQARDVNGKT